MYNKYVLAHYGFLYVLLLVDNRHLILETWSVNVSKCRCATKRGKKRCAAAPRIRRQRPVSFSEADNGKRPLHNGENSVKHVLLIHKRRNGSSAVSNVARTAVSAITEHLSKWSLHQIQGGAMNAAHAHVSASLLYKGKLRSDLRFVHSFIL